MKRSVRLVGVLLCALALHHTPAPAASAAPLACPKEPLRFGVEPYTSPERLTLAYTALTQAIAREFGCPIKLVLSSTYYGEAEAMRLGNIDVAEFGPLGYVLAHRSAHAEAVASYADATGRASTYRAAIATWQGSGIRTLRDVRGRSFAFSDPESTSGHLYPAMALRVAGIDPDHDITPQYTGSHSASYEALRAHQVDAGELNSTQVQVARAAGSYDASLVTLWTSPDIPSDPIAISRKLDPVIRTRLTLVLQSLDLTGLPADVRMILPSSTAPRLGAINDVAYDGIRKLVKTLNIDLQKL